MNALNCVAAYHKFVFVFGSYTHYPVEPSEKKNNENAVLKVVFYLVSFERS